MPSVQWERGKRIDASLLSRLLIYSLIFFWAQNIFLGKYSGSRCYRLMVSNFLNVPVDISNVGKTTAIATISSYHIVSFIQEP